MVGTWWGLLGLAALPVILAIHLFRHRFVPRSIAGLFLWTSPGRDPSAGRRLHKLESTLSLLLELALAAALAAYLLDLRLGGTSGAEHRVIVLDSSASMGARFEGVETAAAARETVRRLLEEAGRQGQASLVTTGRRPSLLAGPAAPVREALAALERWVPRERGHGLGPSLELARELAGPGAVVHIVTDRLPEPGGVDVALHWHAVGRALPNAAILAARRETGSGAEDTIFLRIGYWGDRIRNVDLCVRFGAAPPIDRSLPLAPGSEKRFTLPVPAAEPSVEIVLSPDALDADNRAILLRPPTRRVRTAIDLPDAERTAVEAALRAVPEAVPAAAGEKPQLVFASADRASAGLPETWWCRIGAPPVSAEAKDYLGPFVMEKAHPILEGVSLGGVIWGGAGTSPEALIPLVSAGDRPLVALRPAPEGVDLWLNLRLDRSNLTKTSDWPILVSNIVRMREQELPGASTSNVRAGDALTVRLSREAAGPARLVQPGGGERPIPGRGRVTLDLLEVPGVYRVMEGERELHAFAVNFQDAGESDLGGATEGERAPEAPPTADVRRAEALVDWRVHFPLLLFALALLIANAFVLRRAPAGGAA